MSNLNVMADATDANGFPSELPSPTFPLSNNEASFQYLFTHNPLPMWVYDLETLAFLEVNDAAIATYGYTRAEFLRMHLLDIRPPEDEPHVLDDAAPKRPTLQFSGQWQHRLKNGRLMDVEISSHTLEWAGRAASLMVAQDITKHRQTEEALQDSIQKIKMAYEQTTIYARELNVKITELKQAEASLRQKADDLAVLYEASQVFLGQSDVKTALQTACRLVVERFNLQMSWVGLITQDDFEVDPTAVFSTNNQSYLYSIQTTWDDSLHGQGPTGQAVRTAQAVTKNNLETDPAYEPWRQAALADGYRSTAALPLLHDQEVLGVLNVYSVDPNYFTADRLQTLQSFANLLAVALAKARLFVQAQRRLEELAAIYRASQHLQHLHTPETLAQQIIHVLAETLVYDYGTVLLLDQATGRLVPFAVSEGGQQFDLTAAGKSNLIASDLHLGMGITGWVAQTGQSVCLGDVRQDARYHTTHPDIRSKLCVPLRVGDQIIGVINVETTRLNAYTEADQRVLETVAAQIAIAVQNARLFEQVHAARERLQLLSQQLVEAQEAERRHIARELHDEIGQTLTAVKINLQAMQRLSDAALTTPLAESVEIVEQAIQQVRNLSLDLRPSMLDDLGLVATLRWYLDRQAKWAGFAAQFIANPPDMQLPSNLETVCFRLVQEALTNVLRHAQAQWVQVELQQHETELELLIRDDGLGFEVETTLERVAYGTGLGLLGMQERVTLLGGRLELHSAPGRGTRIQVYLPLPSLSNEEENE